MLLVQTEVVTGWSFKPVHDWLNEIHWSHRWYAMQCILFCFWLLFRRVYDFCLIQSALSLCTWNANVVVCLEQHPKFKIQMYSKLVLSIFCWKWNTCKTGMYLQRRKWWWSGGAKVLGKLLVPGRPTIWMIVGQGPIALAVGAGGVVWTFLLSAIFSPFSPFLWEATRYRLKYCLKGPLNPTQPTNESATQVKRLNKQLFYTTWYILGTNKSGTVVVLLCYVRGKHLRSCRDGQLT